jgi:replicative DNA helicase
VTEDTRPPNPYADHAFAYRRAGWHGVLPIPTPPAGTPPGKGKPPAGYTGAKNADVYPSPADIQTWIDWDPERGNIALRLPRTVLGIDVDAYDGKAGAATLAKWEDRWGALPPTVMSTSRTDGSGIRLFRVPERPSWRGEEGGVELIWHGHRYVIVWPSVHAEGRIYRWIDQRTGEVLERHPSIDLAELPDAWVAGLGSDTDPVVGDDVDWDQAKDYIGAFPDGDPCKWVARIPGAAMIELNGGAGRHPTTASAVMELIRAGHREHPGVDQALSAVGGMFTQLTTKSGKRQRTKRQATHEWREIVMSAVGKVKAKPTPEKDRGCRCGGGPRLTDAPDPDGTQWDPPNPVPKAPITPLPPVSGTIGTTIGEVARAYQVPRDLPFLAALGVSAIAIGGRRRVRVTPDWVEVLAIYAAALLPSGERKSPVVGAMSAPLRDAERELIDGAMPTYRLRRDLYDAHDAAVKQLKRKGDTSPDAMDELRQARETLDSIEVPTLPRLVVDDVTPEAMARIMAEQDGRIGVLSTEAGLFATLAGRYSNGTPNLDLVLKAWSGDSCRVDRIGRDPDILDEPVLSMVLAFQPDVLAGFAETRQFRGAGLLARWIYALPETKLGARELRPQAVAEDTFATYSRKLKRLVRTMNASDTADIKLTAEAVDIFDGFRAAVEPRLHPDVGDLHDLADWVGKLPGQVVRVAAALTLFEDPDALEVDGDMMREAVSLADYFVDHARRAFDLMLGRRSPSEPARAALQWIRRKRLAELSIRDAWRGLHGQAWAESTDDVRDAIDDLEHRGWVRRLEPDGGPGRPTERYITHPVIQGEAP